MFKKKGFTLLELLIVIAVISILIGITLPRFRAVQEEGNIAKVKGELRTLQTAVESYYIHHNNVYPTVAQFANLSAERPQIVAGIPNDPFRTPAAAYQYALSPNSQYYVVYSVGPGDAAGSATINNAGVVAEVNGQSCIYVSNGAKDAQP